LQDSGVRGPKRERERERTNENMKTATLHGEKNKFHVCGEWKTMIRDN
jgi:hypothetical protein